VLKLLLKFLVSIVVVVISAYVARHDTLNGTRADAPLSFVGAVVNRIGGMFGGTSQGNVAASTGSSDVISSVGSALANGNREIERSDQNSAVPNIARTADSILEPVDHKRVPRDKRTAKKKSAAATRVASVNTDPPAPLRAFPEQSAMIASHRVATASQKAMAEDDIAHRTFETDELSLSAKAFRSVTGSLLRLLDPFLVSAREYEEHRTSLDRIRILSRLFRAKLVE
jgi:hypothetical protein